MCLNLRIKQLTRIRFKPPAAASASPVKSSFSRKESPAYHCHLRLVEACQLREILSSSLSMLSTGAKDAVCFQFLHDLFSPQRLKDLE
ncbi:hypothetical protein ILYODFUR_037893 [Ilyodon furcidens]|uniref:Uncharacterized protein n=1 Tax=Ilyodon furcidens TaxID=33524 RepID=A0ABV0T6A6_9TELE